MFTYYLSASRKSVEIESSLFTELAKFFNAKPDKEYPATIIFESDLIFYKKFKQVEKELKGYHFSMTQKPEVEGEPFPWDRSDNNFARDLDRNRGQHESVGWGHVQGRLEERLSEIGYPVEFEEGWANQ